MGAKYNRRSPDKKKNKCGFLLFFYFVLFPFYSSIQKEN